VNIIVNDLLTHYEKTGKGKSVLLILPGWGHTTNQWEALSNLLLSNITVICLDLPSFGQTQSLQSTPGVPEYSQFVVAFIKKLKLKNITLLGHSFGGQIATDMVLHHPELVEHLIFISPANIRNTRVGVMPKIRSVLKPLISVLPKSVVNYLFQKSASTDYLNSDISQRNVLNNILKQDYSSKLSRISTPTSIIWGSEDKEIPYMGKFLAEQIPNSKLYVLYGADHSPQLSSPEKLASIIDGIIKEK